MRLLGSLVLQLSRRAVCLVVLLCAMAPSPVKRMICNTGKKCVKALMRLSRSNRLRPNDPAATVAEVGTPVAPPTVEETPRCRVQEEDSKSCVTLFTWLDDVRDLEDMENHLNEALEMKMLNERLV